MNFSIDDEKLYGGGAVRFAYGLLVASAPDSTDAHDDWDPNITAIHAGPDSLYISVRQSASGPVTLMCVEGPFVAENLSLLFSGELKLSDEMINIYDPNEAIALQLPVVGKMQTVEIYGDDPDDLSEIILVLTRIP